MERSFKGVWIPKEIWLDEKLSLLEKVFLVEINSLDNDERGCFATNAYFAKFFRLSKNRVSIIINQLIKRGYVKGMIKFKAGTREVESRVLSIIKKNNTYIREQIDPVFENVDTPICENAKENNTSINNTVNTPPKSPKGDVADLWFEKFYKAYPKKKGKASAEKAWKKLKPNNELVSVILKAVERMKLSTDWQKDGGEYIPHPATWLNGRRWEDEISIPPTNSQLRPSAADVWGEFE